jgi:hypothetical protein
VCVRAIQLIKTLALHFAYSDNKGKGKFLPSFKRGSSHADSGVCFNMYIYIKQTRSCYLMYEMKFDKEIVNLCYGSCQTPTSANFRYIMVKSSKSNSNRMLWLYSPSARMQTDTDITSGISVAIGTKNDIFWIASEWNSVALNRCDTWDMEII